MDPLSITAGVIAVLQLTREVIDYLHDVKNAPKECRKCIVQAASLQSLLTEFRIHLEDATSTDPWYDSAQLLAVKNGPLDQYEHALKQLLSQVESRDGVDKAMKRLLWKFSKADVEGILQRMERLKSFLCIAVQLDHLYVQWL
jgi:hypothetical protein